MKRKYTVMAITVLAVAAVALVPSLIAAAGFTVPGADAGLRYDPQVLLSAYQVGERLLDVSVVGSDISVVYDGQTVQLGYVVGYIDGVPQTQTHRPVEVQVEVPLLDEQGNPMLDWDGVPMTTTGTEIIQQRIDAEMITTDSNRVALEWDYGAYVRQVTIRKGELQDKYTYNDRYNDQFIPDDPEEDAPPAVVVTVVYDGTPYLLTEQNDELELSHNVTLQDSESVIWFKDLILWTESRGYRWVSFFYDARLLPLDLDGTDKLEYWQEMQVIALESFASVNSDSTKDYSLYQTYYVGDPVGDENYHVTGMYDSNPWGIPD